MNRGVTEQVADALGITDSESVTAISLALTYLGVTTSFDSSHPSNNDCPNIVIPLRTAGEQVGCFAKFDHRTKSWRYDGVPADCPDERYNAKISPDRKDIQSLERTTKDDELERIGGDWTEQFPRTTHIQFVLDTDWSVTALGPMSTWPITLRLMTRKMLADPRPACLYW